MIQNRKKVIKKDLSGSTVKIYGSIGEASRENKIDYYFLWHNIEAGKLFMRGFTYEKENIK